MDHTTAWIDSDGERVLICQPYHLYSHSCASIAETCKRFDLKASIHGNGFYGYGTICIELRPRSSASGGEIEEFLK
jgi:hypothetical protein